MTARSDDDARDLLALFLQNLTELPAADISTFVERALANRTVSDGSVGSGEDVWKTVLDYRVHVPAPIRLPQAFRDRPPAWPNSATSTFANSRSVGQIDWGTNTWRFYFTLPERVVHLGNDTLVVDAMDLAFMEAPGYEERAAPLAARMRAELAAAGLPSGHPLPEEMNGPVC